ncbi:hypothetical protein VNO77_33363 [Canavalia gladiata]|uniref:Uncharacterized protein n=1 Tax=Canavalia gladiata TaxID=3824 RepID=A0AAN9KC89_CANGL
MHDLIQSMGKEIVTQQSTWPEKRNRVWLYKDVICVLEKNKENHKTQAMVLDMPEDEEVEWNEEKSKVLSHLMFTGCSNVTVIPECVQECSLLERLYVHNCKQLREVRGFPPKVPDFSAGNTLVKADNSILKELLKRAIHSNRIYFYALPGERIPEWFDQINRGNSVSFWFRKNVPSLTVSVVTGCWDNIEPPFILNFSFYAKINDEDVRLFQNVWGYIFCLSETDHIFIVKLLDYLRHPMNLVIEKALSENEWIYGKVSFVMRPEDSRCSGMIKWIGVYVNREISTMEDIQFINPCPPRYACDDTYDSISDMPNQLREAQQQLTNFESGNSDSEWTIVDSSNELGESSQASGFDVMQHIEAQGPTSSSDKEKHGVYIGSSSSELPTTIREFDSRTNQTEISQDDDEDMEAFYDSLDAQTQAVSCPNEEAREALERVQDFFISNDASVLLHPEQCSVMKTSLENLSNLYADDDMLREVRTLISEASKDFTHWSLDYTEASKKIECAASELKRVDEVEAGLQTNRKQFKEVMASKNEVQDRLAKMEKRKEDLEEQLNATKANISVCKADITASELKKRDIFEEAKMLKTQRDELRGKAPHLQHEHDSAKETQTRVQSECVSYGTFLKHQEVGLGGSYQSSGFDMMQNIEAQSPTSWSDKEIHGAVLPTTFGTFDPRTNQIEITQDDDVNMEAFYDSLDA